MSAPDHWHADILLNDGSLATIRAIAREDRGRLINFYSRVSDRSKYFRFFSTHPELTDDDLAAWLDVDGHDTVTLVAEESGTIIAVANYSLIPDFLPTRVGNVSFLVQDQEQGRGLGILLLEHLAEVGREQGIDRFTAEMLTQNRQMKWVFVSAGYQVSPELDDGFITVDFPIAPSEASTREMERRELRSESNSIHRLLSPRSVVIFGQSALARSTRDTRVFTGVLRLLDGATPAESLAELIRIEGPVDLVVSDYDPELFPELVAAAEKKGATGLLLATDGRYRGLSSAEYRAVVCRVRSAGMRMLGPSSLGFVNTHPDVRLHLTPHARPRRGRVGIFSQSAGVATLMLSRAVERGIGISTFVSTGPLSDITANDMLQFWTVDETTDVCLLSIDSIGNPRKFFRLLRRLAQHKHVVAFMPSRAMRFAHHYEDPSLHTATPAALDEVIRRAGAIVVTRRDTMFDVSQVLARQPLPTSRNVAVISNSPGLTQQMEQSASRFGLRGVVYDAFDDDCLPAIVNAVHRALADPEIGAVAVTAVELGSQLHSIHEALTEVARSTAKPLLASFVGFEPMDPATTGTEERGQLPVYDTYAEALEALSHVWHAINHCEPQDAEGDEAVRPVPDLAPHAALTRVRSLISEIVADSPNGRWATEEECATLLSCYGISVLPWRVAHTAAEASTHGEELGWDVVLKCASPAVRTRSELPVIVRHIRNDSQMRQAWHQLITMCGELGLGSDPTVLEPVVQKNVPSGTSLTIRAFEDRVIGPLLSVGITGTASDLLGDVVWCTPPLDHTRALTLLNDLRAAALLDGYRGVPGVDKAALAHLLVAVSALNDANPAVTEIELSPVIAGCNHTEVVGARLNIAPLPLHRDPLARTVS